jgi:hypothetical protein
MQSMCYIGRIEAKIKFSEQILVYITEYQISWKFLTWLQHAGLWTNADHSGRVV